LNLVKSKDAMQAIGRNKQTKVEVTGNRPNTNPLKERF